MSQSAPTCSQSPVFQHVCPRSFNATGKDRKKNKKDGKVSKLTNFGGLLFNLLDTPLQTQDLLLQ